MTYTERLYFLDLGSYSYNPRNGRVLSSNPDGSDFRELITGLDTRPDGIAVDRKNEHIYWTNMGVTSENDGFIQRCDLSGNNIVTIIPPGITHTPKQLKIAPKTRKLYWSDREGMKVMRSNINGSNVEILYRAGCPDQGQDCRNWCVGMAVDEVRNKIYWTQKGPTKGGQGRIFCMDLNQQEGHGSGVRLLLDNLSEPVDLSLDEESNTLYWTDRGQPPLGNSVNAVNLQALSKMGDLASTLLVPNLQEGIGISIDVSRNRMFFGDISGHVYTSRLDGSYQRLLLDGMGDTTGIAFTRY